MIVAALQPDIAWEQPRENFERVTALAERAARDGARLLALPEMFATGFSMRAEAMATHAAVTEAFLARLARRLGVWLVAGFVAPGEPRPRNVCTVVDPSGVEALRYAKIHGFSLAGEPEQYDPGEGVATVAVEGARVTPLICYDLRFVELFRAAADDTDLYVVVANWPERRHHAWRTLLAARAIDCQAWVLGVNRVGQASGADHLGGSALLDPLGHPVSELERTAGVVLGDVDPLVVRDLRRRYPFLADRRPEVYGCL